MESENEILMEQAIQELLGEPSQSPPRAEVQINVAVTKVRVQIDQLIAALPLSIASRIMSCEFFKAHGREPAHYVIRFDNRRTVTFTDIDAFPSDEHVARIALECP